MTRQDQRVATGAVAVQATGDVIVNNGPSPEQMAEIMVALGKQLASGYAEARAAFEERLGEFRNELLEEFTSGRANPQAFRDPDFQHVLNDAQGAYARSGDQDVGDVLVQMIATRSQCEERSRLSLTLNQAVDVATVLTANEFAELSLSFLVTRVFNQGVTDIQRFCEWTEKFLIPFLPHVSDKDSSYQYLVSHGCVVLDDLRPIGMADAIRHNYSGMFSRGFTQDELSAALQNNDHIRLALRDIIIPYASDPSKLQFRALNQQNFQGALLAKPLSAQERTGLESLYSSSIMGGDELLDTVERALPEFAKLRSLWGDTPLKHMRLTSLGIAIAHANVKRVLPDFNADLSIWIQ